MHNPTITSAVAVAEPVRSVLAPMPRRSLPRRMRARSVSVPTPRRSPPPRMPARSVSAPTPRRFSPHAKLVSLLRTEVSFAVRGIGPGGDRPVRGTSHNRALASDELRDQGDHGNRDYLSAVIAASPAASAKR